MKTLLLLVLPLTLLAQPDKAAVLDLLESLPIGNKDRVISGQFGGSGQWLNTELAELETETGHFPGIRGADYGVGGQVDTSGNWKLIEHWNAGGLVTISWHQGNPTSGGEADDGQPVNWNDLLTPGTPTYTAWADQLSQVLIGLDELRQAGVVVLWRPYHEMNRSPFWWSTGTPQQFKALWNQLHFLFGAWGQLEHTIWVWSPKHDGSNFGAWHPETAQVDVVAMDVYADDLADALPSYQQLAAYGKPIALGEYGPGWSVDPMGNLVINKIDYARLIDAIKSQMPKIVYWQSWAGPWGMQDSANGGKLLEHGWVVNRPLWQK